MVTVVYNGYTLPLVIDKFSASENEREFSFSCTFLVTSTSAGGLVTACQTAEEKLTEIDKAFTLSFGGSSEFSFSHSGSTGFLARPKLSKLNSTLCTETSRAYSFSVTIQLPFTQYNARRDAKFTVAYGETRQRVVSFSGNYTATTGGSALTNYSHGSTGGKAWAEDILSAMTGTYEIVSESLNEDQENKVVQFSLTYKEILANQSKASVNVSSIVDPTVNYSVRYDQLTGVSETGGYTTYPKVGITITYSCRISRDVVVTDTSIDSVYHNTVRPWLLEHVRNVLALANYTQAGTEYIIQSESKSIDSYNYTVNGSMTLTAPKMRDVILELTESVTINDDYGIISDKLWDGHPHTFNSWSVGGKLTLSRSITISKLGSEPPEPWPYEILPVGYEPGVWLKRSSMKRKEVQKIGCGTYATGLYDSLVYHVTYTEQYIYVVASQYASETPMEII